MHTAYQYTCQPMRNKYKYYWSVVISNTEFSLVDVYGPYLLQNCCMKRRLNKNTVLDHRLEDSPKLTSLIISTAKFLMC